ncbi:VOC family protein [Reichenbachiella ulvae]|uniref:VOC family protein n=1 Tax=Reichenbachiella ulvae TaxID=2980104 RepID=A0ABT3CSC0_9BACT|nr:VOC family protein [Reichenbachiella ulvae]MCV9386577.1 VOC family protein [Reichenbachiella ulvae]
MNFDRTGIILYVIDYEACLQFYEQKLGLKKLFHTEALTCFEFGSSYLMIEMDDEYLDDGNDSSRIRTCLRMNVPNVKKLATQLESEGVSVDYQEHNWGTVAKFYDPDGNLCAFKDSAKFEAHM